jgi:hypothetical protein
MYQIRCTGFTGYLGQKNRIFETQERSEITSHQVEWRLMSLHAAFVTEHDE